MYQAKFEIDGSGDIYTGYTSGRLWNGWATPYFEKAEADRLMQDFNLSALLKMRYDEGSDSYIIDAMEYYDGDYWEGNDVQTEEGIKHLYGIGAYSWIWDEIEEESGNEDSDL